MKMVLVRPGKFMMGSPAAGNQSHFDGGLSHEVAITKPFYIGATEVTQAQYQAVMGTNPSYFKGPANPVEQVSWDEATEFCKKLSEKSRQTFRLPTEAEWEYACRVGTQTGYSFGDKPSDLGEYAWYGKGGGNKSHPAGQKKPNAWGLYDMHGNVLEWCADWLGDYPKGAVTDPQGPQSGTYRVTRGGSWLKIDPDDLRSARRSCVAQVFRRNDIGFRCVRNP
jgi:formylglycine-generating enzyme required for sulfatase activity